MKKEIIVLAKSVKRYPNYCIAGIDVETGEWIRPVSSFREIEGAIPRQHIIYVDGTELRPLDIVEIDIIDHVPTRAQKENYTYRENIRWKKTGEIELEEVIKKYGINNTEYIFENYSRELNNDEIKGESLLFVKIQNPVIVIKKGYDGKKKITIEFDYKGRRYANITIGDMNLKDNLIGYDFGTYRDPNCVETYAVFSLTGQYSETGKYYKMLAQLF